MQSLTKPRDGEWELAQDLTELSGLTVYANMPDEIATPCAAVIQVGIVAMTPTIWEHDFSIDVWAGSGSDYADAWDAARTLAGSISLLQTARPTSGNDWHNPEITNLYPNPDPNRPDIPRVTIACNLGLPGDSLY